MAASLKERGGDLLKHVQIAIEDIRSQVRLFFITAWSPQILLVAFQHLIMCTAELSIFSFRLDCLQDDQVDAFITDIKQNL